MTILEERFQISEENPSRIGAHWKFMHILLFVVISISGLTTVFIFQNVLDDFNNFCVLNAKIVFFNDSVMHDESKLFIGDTSVNTDVPISTTATTIPELDINTRPPISLRKTRWGNVLNCSFVQYTPLVSALFSLIWGTFFIMLSKGGAGYGSDILPSPWRIVFPCFVFSTIFSTVVLVSTILMTQGLNEFCAQFETQVHLIKCNPLIDNWTLQFHPQKKPFFQHYNVAKMTAFIGLCGWFFQVFILILRFVTFTDFKMEYVQIRDKDKEVQKDVNLTNGEQV